MNKPPIPHHEGALKVFYDKLRRSTKKLDKAHPKRAGLVDALKHLRTLMEKHDKQQSESTDPRCEMWCRQKIYPLWKFKVDRMHLRAMFHYAAMSNKNHETLKVNQAGTEITFSDDSLGTPPIKDFRRRSERLAYVGLLDKVGDCTWKLNDLGWNFLQGKASIPEFYWMRDGECYGTSTDMVTRDQVGTEVWNRAFWLKNAPKLVQRI